MQPNGPSPEFVYIGSRTKPQRGARRTPAAPPAAPARGHSLSAQMVLRGFIIGLVFWAGSLFALSVAG